MKHSTILLLVMVFISNVNAQSIEMFNYNYPFNWNYDCNSMVIGDSVYYIAGDVGRIIPGCEYILYGYHITKINSSGLKDTTVIFDNCGQTTYIGWGKAMKFYSENIVIIGREFHYPIFNRLFLTKLNLELDTLNTVYFMDDTVTKRAPSFVFDNSGNIVCAGGIDSSYNEMTNPTPSSTYSKSLLYKISPTGETIWKKSYSMTNCISGCWSSFFNLVNTFDNGFVAIGPYAATAGINKNAIVKVDSLGNQKWVRFYGNPNYDNPNLLDIVETADSCIVVCGAYTYGETGGGLYPYDGWLIKLDKDGNEKWNRKYRDHVLTGMSDWRDTIYSFYMGIYERENGDLITISATHSDENGAYIADKFRLRCLDSEGNIQWDKVIDSVGGQTGILQAQSVKPTADGGIAVAGSAEIFYMDGTQWTSDQRIFLIKTDSLGNDVETTVRPVAAQAISEFGLVCYPNPANGEFWVDLPQEGNGEVLEIYATNGSLVHEQPATPGLNRVDLCGVKPGMYLLRLKATNVFGKVVVE